MKKIKGDISKTIVLMVLLALVILGFYYRFTNDSGSNRFSKEKSEVDILINKDIEGNYPASPREVLKTYCKISKIFYSKALNDKEINLLAEQLRKLFDEELLNNNPIDPYLENLKSEIKEYKAKKQKIVNYMIQKGEEVKYWEKQDQEYASIVVSYLIEKDGKYMKTYEKFVLRKDADGEWKILGWTLTDKIDIKE